MIEIDSESPEQIPLPDTTTTFSSSPVEGETVKTTAVHRDGRQEYQAIYTQMQTEAAVSCHACQIQLDGAREMLQSTKNGQCTSVRMSGHQPSCVSNKEATASIFPTDHSYTKVTVMTPAEGNTILNNKVLVLKVDKQKPNVRATENTLLQLSKQHNGDVAPEINQDCVVTGYESRKRKKQDIVQSHGGEAPPVKRSKLETVQSTQDGAPRVKLVKQDIRRADKDEQQLVKQGAIRSSKSKTLQVKLTKQDVTLPAKSEQAKQSGNQKTVQTYRDVARQLKQAKENACHSAKDEQQRVKQAERDYVLLSGDEPHCIPQAKRDILRSFEDELHHTKHSKPVSKQNLDLHPTNDPGGRDQVSEMTESESRDALEVESDRMAVSSLDEEAEYIRPHDVENVKTKGAHPVAVEITSSVSHRDKRDLKPQKRKKMKTIVPRALRRKPGATSKSSFRPGSKSHSKSKHVDVKKRPDKRKSHLYPPKNFTSSKRVVKVVRAHTAHSAIHGTEGRRLKSGVRPSSLHGGHECRSPEIPLQNNSLLNDSISSDVDCLTDGGVETRALPLSLMASNHEQRRKKSKNRKKAEKVEMTDSAWIDREEILKATNSPSRAVFYDCIGSNVSPRSRRKSSSTPEKRLSLIRRRNRLPSREIGNQVKRNALGMKPRFLGISTSFFESHTDIHHLSSNSDRYKNSFILALQQPTTDAANDENYVEKAQDSQTQVAPATSNITEEDNPSLDGKIEGDVVHTKASKVKHTSKLSKKKLDEQSEDRLDEENTELLHGAEDNSRKVAEMKFRTKSKTSNIEQVQDDKGEYRSGEGMDEVPVSGAQDDDSQKQPKGKQTTKARSSKKKQSEELNKESRVGEGYPRYASGAENNTRKRNKTKHGSKSKVALHVEHTEPTDEEEVERIEDVLESTLPDVLIIDDGRQTQTTKPKQSSKSKGTAIGQTHKEHYEDSNLPSHTLVVVNQTDANEKEGRSKKKAKTKSLKAKNLKRKEAIKISEEESIQDPISTGNAVQSSTVTSNGFGDDNRGVEKVKDDKRKGGKDKRKSKRKPAGHTLEDNVQYLNLTSKAPMVVDLGGDGIEKEKGTKKTKSERKLAKPKQVIVESVDEEGSDRRDKIEFLCGPLLDDVIGIGKRNKAKSRSESKRSEMQNEAARERDVIDEENPNQSLLDPLLAEVDSWKQTEPKHSSNSKSETSTKTLTEDKERNIVDEGIHVVNIEEDEDEDCRKRTKAKHSSKLKSSKKRSTEKSEGNKRIDEESTAHHQHLSDALLLANPNDQEDVAGKIEDGSRRRTKAKQGAKSKLSKRKRTEQVQEEESCEVVEEYLKPLPGDGGDSKKTKHSLRSMSSNTEQLQQEESGTDKEGDRHLDSMTNSLVDSDPKAATTNDNNNNTMKQKSSVPSVTLLHDSTTLQPLGLDENVQSGEGKSEATLINQSSVGSVHFSRAASSKVSDYSSIVDEQDSQLPLPKRRKTLLSKKNVSSGFQLSIVEDKVHVCAYVCVAGIPPKLNLLIQLIHPPPSPFYFCANWVSSC